MKKDLGPLRIALRNAFGEFYDVVPDFTQWSDENFAECFDEELVEYARRAARLVEKYPDDFPVHPDNIEEDAVTVIDNLLRAANDLERAIEDETPESLETDHAG